MFQPFCTKSLTCTLQAAETGSGKTGVRTFKFKKNVYAVLWQAFCLPIIQIVHETLRDRQEGRAPRALGTGGCL